MQKKKILHLITGLDVGGAEMMLLKTLPKIQTDFDNRVCCIMGHGPIGQKLKTAGIPVYYLDLKNIFDFSVILKFKKSVKNFQPDILVTYLIHADLFGRMLGKIFGIKKIVCSQRGSLLQWEYLRFFDRLTRFLVTKYIVQTETAKKDLMRKLRVAENKFVVIPNGIDTEGFNFEINVKDKKSELKINPKNINIICVSKLRDGKGHKYLLKAFEESYNKNKNVNLMLVGDGEKREKLLDQIENYESKNNIYFLGDRSDVKEILKISDIFILPTLGEGMSNAIMEAMASGLPIITTDIEVNKELIENNKTGILIPIKNIHEISVSVEKLISDPNYANSLGMRAKEKIYSDFSIDIIDFKISSFLKSL